MATIPPAPQITTDSLTAVRKEPTLPGLRCALALSLLALAACHDSDSSSSAAAPATPPPAAAISDCAVARVAAGPADLVPGPLARGTAGDIVIENRRMRAIIQKGGRNWFNIGQFGGNIIDAVPKAADGSLAAEDHYEEASLGTNIESSPNYDAVTIVNAGGEDADGKCIPAVVRATGPDDLLDFVNGSSAIRDMGFSFPQSADDVDLPVTVHTDYTLDANQSAVTMNSTIINASGSDLRIYLAEYVNGSGEVELFQHGYGFGEALITAPCASCRSIIYAGHEGGSGVSYGIVHNTPRTTTLSVSGVTVLVYGTDATVLAAVPEPLNQVTEPPPFTVPANGELSFTRWFVVGTGSVASILDTQYSLLGVSTGSVGGTVTDQNGPVSGAEIAVIGSDNDFTPIAPGVLPLPYPPIPGARGPATLVVNHMRTDASGRFQGRLPPGDYQLRLNIPGRGALPGGTANVSVTENQLTTQNFTAPLPAQLRVLVVDENNLPIAAKVQLIGSDSSPDAGEPQNQESVLGGLLTLNTGIFGDFAADKLPGGVILSEFAVADPLRRGAVTVGDTGLLEAQAGEFVLSVSRGPRYSEHSQTVTLTPGAVTTVTARLVKVVDTTDHLLADFHVHSFNSPDSEVTNRERLITYLSEDMDFFTPSDHGYRANFEPVIADMQVGHLLASAPSAEITTFDYGHYNAWPVRIEAEPANSDEASQSSDLKISQGATDWGGPAPRGQDFPSAGNFSREPAKIFDEMRADPLQAGRQVVVQINHVDSFFGAGGLEIDSGFVGKDPQSNVTPASKRLNPALTNLFDRDFDSLELWIGVDGREHQLEKFLGQNIGDWFNLLNRGLLRTLVANSDTHDRRLTSLSTRNYISAPTVLSQGQPDPQKMRQAPHDIGDAIRNGYSTGSNSLFMQVKASNALTQGAGLEQSDAFGVKTKPLVALGGKVSLKVDIQSPVWAEYDEISVYINTPTTRHKDQFGQPSSPARYNICSPEHRLGLADFSRTRVPVTTIDGTTYQRLESSATIDLTLLKDSWVVVLARGNDGVSKPLWPVVPNDFSDSGDGLGTRSSADTGTVAMAVSNPIYVDVDGNGWHAPALNVVASCP
ncbi:MAG: hypothetical protein CMN85_13080 [Spongiibacteraceae bacterium]|nr:hypothetical protein [Spongiibacteraceae bacterium]